MSAVHAELERIRVHFATYRDRTTDDRAAFAVRVRGLPADERVLLDTCHRVELVTVGESDAPEPQLTGRDAVHRVFEVVAGFDSAVVAEEQLLGQVRGAYEAALTEGSTGPILNELFRRALRFGRRVRTHARPGTDRSLADPGVAWLLDRLAPGSRVAVAGTGEIGRLVALRLAAAGHRMTVVSSSADRGGRLIEQLPGEGHHFAVGPIRGDLVARSDAVALAVRTRSSLITAADLPDAAPPWFLDLSAPAAVSADAADALGERLLTLDRIGRLAGAAPVLEPATERRLRAELDREVEAFATWLEQRRGADALAQLHGGAEAVRSRHLERLRRRAGLDPGQLAAVEAASAAMLGELLHGPSVELRRGGADAETVRRLFGLEA